MPRVIPCPACGAPLRIKSQFVKLVTCDFCGQVSLLKGEALDPTGRTAALTEMPSRLFVEATGEIEGKRFRVMGRLRYQYESGVWDEWFLTFNDEQPGWLVEDEGTFKFYQKSTLPAGVPPFESLRVGSTVQIGGQPVFVVEKGTARILGGEGQLAFAILPGEQIDYVDGASNGQQVSLEYTEREIEFSAGRAIEPDQILID